MHLFRTIFGATLLMITASTFICYFWEKDEKDSILSKLIHSFSFIDNWNQWLDLKSSRSLKFLEGIRVLTFLHIILFHENTQIFSKPYLNLEKLMQAVYNHTYTPLWLNTSSVDVFLLLSGLLRSYNLIKSYDQGKFEIVKPIIRRYLGLAPVYFFVIIFYATILDQLDNGPEWNSYVKDHTEDCRTHWWKNLLFINNYFPNNCHAGTWYLAMDMQMFILAPLVVYPLWKWQILGKLILGFALSVSCVLPMVQLYFLDFPTQQILFKGPESRQHTFYSNFYTRTHVRMSPYLVGVFMGIILRRNKTMIKYKMRQTIYWLLCFGTLLEYSYWHLSLADESETFAEKFEVALYYSLGHLGFSVALAWIIYTCFFENDGIITRFLSCNIFMYLGKLTYCMYLVHYEMIFYLVGITQVPDVAHPFVVIRNLVGDFGIILFFTLLVYLLVESPFSNVTAMLFGKSNEKSRKKTAKKDRKNL